VGADADHPAAVAAGLVELSFTIYPATPTLSLAVNDEIATVREVAVDGTLKADTVGGAVSAADGLLAASPGKVRAVISARFVTPSPSESRGSMVAKLCPLFP